MAYINLKPKTQGVDSLFGAISHLGTERQKGMDLQPRAQTGLRTKLGCC